MRAPLDFPAAGSPHTTMTPVVRSSVTKRSSWQVRLDRMQGSSVTSPRPLQYTVAQIVVPRQSHRKRSPGRSILSKRTAKQEDSSRSAQDDPSAVVNSNSCRPIRGCSTALSAFWRANTPPKAAHSVRNHALNARSAEPSLCALPPCGLLFSPNSFKSSGYFCLSTRLLVPSSVQRRDRKSVV